MSGLCGLLMLSYHYFKPWCTNDALILVSLSVNQH